jgi:hypothetical protein
MLELVRALYSFVVTIYKCSVNPITNPNPVDSHKHVVILNIPSNLLILYDVDCLNSKEVTPISLSVPAVLLCFCIRGSVEGCSIYLFCLNVFLKCWISLLIHSVSHIVLIWVMSVVSTACFCSGCWCEFAWW